MIKIFLWKARLMDIMTTPEQAEFHNYPPKKRIKAKHRLAIGLIKYILCIYASLIQFSNLHHLYVWKGFAGSAFREMSFFFK